ncbi:MAG TPA: hypothetical protein VL574_05070 [Stellaceae bacterium]|nr:hypothetical protein [Stellaceae bacterium]
MNDQPDEAAPSEAVPPTPTDRSTHFIFDHQVFTVKAARFVIGSDGQPAMIMRLGDIEAALTIKSLRQEFKLDGTADDELLDKVIKGLAYVKIIRPNDSIPSEILDGSASWRIEDRHHDIAKGRLTVQISTWLSGEEQIISDEAALLQIAEDPAIKTRVQAAFTEIAARLGLPADKKQEVIDRIEILANELAYIEALRDRFSALRALRKKVADFHHLYRRDRSFDEEISRIENLMRRPFGEIETIFDQVDAQSGEIISMLRNIQSQIDFIRMSRDELHGKMMLWDDLLPEWEKIKVERSLENEAVMRGLYRFLARHFNIEKAWQLTANAFAGRKS